jgi:hypothetical protein
METSWQLLFGWYVLQFLGVTFVGWVAPFILSILFRHGGSTAPLQICAAAAGALYGLLVRKVTPEVFSRWVWVPTGLCLLAAFVCVGLMDAGLLDPGPGYITNRTCAKLGIIISALHAVVVTSA